MKTLCIIFVIIDILIILFVSYKCDRDRQLREEKADAMFIEALWDILDIDTNAVIYMNVLDTNASIVGNVLGPNSIFAKNIPDTTTLKIKRNEK